MYNNNRIILGGGNRNKYKIYCENINSRNLLHYLLGLIVRWKQSIKYRYACKIARKRGADIGFGVVMPLSLAKCANPNLHIGNHVSIQTDKIDLRSPVYIGNHVIIGANTEIITCSHNIDSPLWEQKYYGIIIEDFVWLPTKVLVLPSCRKIGEGAVVGAGSVVVKDVLPMSVVCGNPAKEIKKRKCVHSELVVESLLGGDYEIYRKMRNNNV